MQCEHVQQLICARVDQQPIDPGDALVLDEHLDVCGACRALAADWAAQDHSVRRAIAVHRDRAAEFADRSATYFRRRRPVSRVREIAMVVLAAAAGFAAAMTYMHVELPTPPASLAFSGDRSIAHLTLATGLVETSPASGSAWMPLATGGDVPAGTRVRTPSGSRCEFRLADGSEIRMNGGSELVLTTTRRVELVRGQVWTRAAAGTVPYELMVRDTNIAGGSTTFDVLAELASIQLTVMHGTTRVRSGLLEQTVRAGQRLAVTDGQPGAPQPADDLIDATRWLHELLMLKGRGDPELAARIDDLFAQIGQTKMDYVYEQEIRSLGDHCVLPLVKYIESDRSLGEQDKRSTAAAIVADLAQPWCIPDLIELLGDADGNVRYHAARALTRLTGQTFGREADSWRDQPSQACEPTVGNWHTWWQENRARFPGGQRPLPPPPSP